MRVFSVPLSAPFLRTVIGALVDGRLVAGFDAPRNDGVAPSTPSPLQPMP